MFGEEPTLPAEDSGRIGVTRERRALLYGRWEQEAIQRLYSRLGAVRRAAVGYPDLSANPFRAICHQAAVLYDRAPRISHPDDDAQRTLAQALSGKLETALWTSKMQRIQRDCIGLREMVVRIDVSEGGELVIRPVFPDRVSAQPDDELPDRPGSLLEARRRQVGGREQWTYDHLDPAAESYTVQTGSGDDVTVEAIGAPASGEAYPYRWSTGEPYLPAVLYHAAPTGGLWDPYELRELHEATYEVCVLWSFWGHCVRDASWPQRWAIDLTVEGATTDGPVNAPRRAVVTDPSTLLLFTRTTADVNGNATPPGQFQAGSNPLELAEALMIYEQRLAAYAGVADPDFIRRSGDPRSGYALAISRDGQRAAARKFEPQFRSGDEQLLAMAAAQINAWSAVHGGTLPMLPESGWRLRYPGLPRTPEEQDAHRRNVLELLAQGMISKVRAYAELHEIDTDEAEAELAMIAAEQPPPTPFGRFDAFAPATTTTTETNNA